MQELAGLSPGQRYRCASCGNLTRFDIESVERVRRFWHLDLSGSGAAEEEERVELRIESITCRWCNATDVEVEDAPGGAAPVAPESAPGAAGGG